MRAIAVLAISVFICISDARALDEAGKDCRLKRLASLDMVFSGGLILLPVTIDGRASQMFLDIGSIASVLEQSAVTDMQLHTSGLPEGSSVSYGGQPIRRMARIHTLTIGNARFADGEFLVSPAPNAPPQAAPIAGTLGMDVFGGVDLELDFINRKVGIFSQHHCPGQVVYWSTTYGAVAMKRGELGNLYFPMQLDGKKIEATLGTGSTTTTLTTDVTNKLYGFDEHSTDIQTEVDAAGNVMSQ